MPPYHLFTLAPFHLFTPSFPHRRGSVSAWWLPALVLAGIGMIAAAALGLRGEAPGVTLAAYSTSLSGRTRNQDANIRVAAERVDGVTLQPGEVFSFARSVGPVSAETGFVRGLAIRDGEPASEDGGGICQVASTIYNAALLANLKIVERRKHLWPVHSVPPGLDATFASGNADMKFQNSLSQVIRVRVIAQGSRLTARIVGDHAEPSQVDVIRSIKAVLPPE